jgi:hypothetical protein
LTVSAFLLQGNQLKGVDYMGKKWTKESIITEFNAYRDSGGDIRSSIIQKQHLPLFKAILRHYGNYKNFLESLGFDYSDIASKRARWTKEEIIKEFKEYELKYKDVKPATIKKFRNDLYLQIGRKFGSYKDFIESLGYSYEEVVGIKQWTKERIISELLSRKSKGLSLRESDLENDYPALRSAAVKHFGSYANAIESCGLNYDEIRGFTFWDKEKIKSEFLKLYNDDSVRKIEDIQERNRGLDHAIRKYYGGYDELCNELNLDINKIRAEVYQWKPDDLLRVLKEMKQNGEPLNVMNVQSRFPTAVKVAERYFGSYENALKAIGENYEDHVEDHVYTSYVGKIFEKLVHKMFEDLGFNYHYQYRGFDGIVPDFYDEENSIILDTKLSSWSVFNCDTISKYSPYCKKIIIVYLRGEDIKHKIPNLELISVDYYFDDLRKKGLGNYIDEINKLRTAISNKESIEKAV